MGFRLSSNKVILRFFCQLGRCWCLPPQRLWFLDRQDCQGQPEGKNDSLQQYQRSGHSTTIHGHDLWHNGQGRPCQDSTAFADINVKCPKYTFSRPGGLHFTTQFAQIALVVTGCIWGLGYACWRLRSEDCAFVGHVLSALASMLILLFFTWSYSFLQLDTSPTYLPAWDLMYLWQLTLNLTYLYFCMFL